MYLLQCGVGIVKLSDNNYSLVFEILNKMEIKNLLDLNTLNSAPNLSKSQIKGLLEELQTYINNSDWITIGVMASSDNEAINALKTISTKYEYIKFNNLDSLQAKGRVFLKANQKTRNVFVRSENGLGEGILITCQNEDSLQESFTFGPFPLDFFKLN